MGGDRPQSRMRRKSHGNERAAASKMLTFDGFDQFRYADRFHPVRMSIRVVESVNSWDETAKTSLSSVTKTAHVES
jgi:hypothetical protein